ncbi:MULTISPECIES: cell division protein ZapA [Oleiagrimonas]|jgi:cell division protein ZapA|uniref:Cell division protein ZapA n=1 Tax=Oleiagrimonas citrea TaxID=1665687 RepID=A0A846ZMD0_9GAMM|nr:MULTISPECIES: cell division protein ZapA [Oleiagrimonas]NKZ39374.1 cell division protein ZapA [Oleiagrimonas citrea]RAP59641.1 cell division protein ZapA [Oleiagrimonas sp. MCCC 1A03011]
MSEPITIRLNDREFLVACEPEERPGLLAAASYLDSKMREFRANARSPGFDRLAVLTALSVTHELLETRQRQESEQRVFGEGIETLRRKLEGALERASGSRN